MLKNEWNWQFVGAQGEPSVSAISIVGNQEVKVELNKSIRLSVTTEPAELSPCSIVWSVAEPQHVEVGQDGTITGKQQGKTKVIVISVGTPSLTAFYSVTVVDATYKPVTNRALTREAYVQTLGQAPL